MRGSYVCCTFHANYVEKEASLLFLFLLIFALVGIVHRYKTFTPDSVLAIPHPGLPTVAPFPGDSIDSIPLRFA